MRDGPPARQTLVCISSRGQADGYHVARDARHKSHRWCRLLGTSQGRQVNRGTPNQTGYPESSGVTAQDLILANSILF